VPVWLWILESITFLHRDATGLHVKCTLLLSNIPKNWNQLTDVSKIPLLDFSRISSVVLRSQHVDRQADMTKLIVTFLQLPVLDAPKSHKTHGMHHL
jgi:hypothetical protein